MKAKKVLGILAVSSIILGGCHVDGSALIDGESSKPPAGVRQGTAIKADMPEVPEALAEYYTQELSWEECGKSNSCVDVVVPMNYDDPTGTTIEIALKKRPANKEAIGTLFINPGGPGGSGVGMVEDASYYLTKDVLNNFDVVGFDPRGVGESTEIDCLDDAELGPLLDQSIDPSLPGWKEESDAVQKKIADGCAAKSGDLLANVGTTQAARDLDVMRQLVGDPKLYYVGFSYGTALGGQYAEFFPENVGRLVLDGAVDTTIGTAQMGYEQTLGFETALKHYVEDCQTDSDCPLTGTVDEGLQTIREALDDSLKNPVPTDDPDRPLTQSLLFSGMTTLLYDDRTWPMLTDAFTALLEDGDGSNMLMVADLATERNSDGTFESNSTEANWAINCADYPVASDEELAMYSEKLVKEAPVFGSMMTEGSDMCASWATHPAAVPGKFTAKGSAPIVVVGTEFDPATPLIWAEKFSQGLDNSVLVTWEGEGHTAYGRAGACIKDPLDSYLLDGTVPKDGLTCK